MPLHLKMYLTTDVFVQFAESFPSDARKFIKGIERDGWERSLGHLLFVPRAMTAYMLGEIDTAIQLLEMAVQDSFPPDRQLAQSMTNRAQFKDFYDGETALRLMIAAHLVHQPQRRDEIGAWAFEKLLSVDPDVLRGYDGHRARLYRTYVHLAAGLPWDHAEEDLCEFLAHARDTLCQFEPPLAETLLALLRYQRGEVPRHVMAGELDRLLCRIPHPEWMPHAAFHVLYLQNRFSEVFDQTLEGLRATHDLTLWAEGVSSSVSVHTVHGVHPALLAGALFKQGLPDELINKITRTLGHPVGAIECQALANGLRSYTKDDHFVLCEMLHMFGTIKIESDEHALELYQEIKQLGEFAGACVRSGGFRAG